MISAKTQVRIRYSETDKMGYVYYGNYAQFFEIGRTNMLRDYGMTYRQMEDSGIMLPVRSMEVRYHSPAFYDDLLTVTTSIKEMPTKRLAFEHEIHNEAGKLVVTGKVELVFVSAETRRPTNPPENFMEKMREVLS